MLSNLNLFLLVKIWSFLLGLFKKFNYMVNLYIHSHKRRFYTCTSPDDWHRNQIYYIPCSQRWRKSIESAKTKPGADRGSNHEHLIAKFRLKLKKVEKTTRPFRYDLNQIPYDYTVEVRIRFKGLDLIECLMNYGSWHYTGDGNQDHPQEKEMQKNKIAVWGGLTHTGVKRRKAKNKGKIYPFECMGSQRVGQDWVTELNWTELNSFVLYLTAKI